MRVSIGRRYAIWCSLKRGQGEATEKRWGERLPRLWLTSFISFLDFGRMGKHPLSLANHRCSCSWIVEGPITRSVTLKKCRYFVSLCRYHPPPPRTINPLRSCGWSVQARRARMALRQSRNQIRQSRCHFWILEWHRKLVPLRWLTCESTMYIRYE